MRMLVSDAVIYVRARRAAGAARDGAGHGLLPCPLGLLTLILMLTGANSVSAVDGRELLESAAATYSASDTISFSAKGRCVWTPLGETADSSTAGSPLQFRFRRDHDLMDVDSRMQASNGIVYRNRMTFGNNLKVAYSIQAPRDAVEAATPEGAVVWQQALDQERARTLSVMPQCGCWLDGYLGTGDKRLVNELLAADAKVFAPKQEAGVKLIEIRGKTEYGTITVWLAPSQGCLVRRAVIRKDRDDLILPNIRLGELEGNLAAEEEHTAWDAEMMIDSVREIGGVWVATSGSVKVTQKFVNGDGSQRTCKLSRTDIELSPQFAEGDFQTDLPAGTRVELQDTQGTGLVHVWDGEWPVVSAVAPSPARRGESGEERP